MSKNLLVFVGVGLLVVAGAVFLIFSSTKGSHLELKGRILKVRTGALSEGDSVAVLDFRLENPTDVVFVVREVSVALEKQDGSKVDGSLVAKTDLKQLFTYNRFLGDPYNDALSIRDKVAPHSTLDRMAAIRFEVPNPELENAKSIHLSIEDLDGAMFETAHKVK